MVNVWLMKTEMRYFPQFIDSTNNVVVIDEQGFDKPFPNLTEVEMSTALSANNRTHPQRIINFFKQFVEEVKIGDVVIVGTGSASSFNANAIGKITGDYTFSNTLKGLRHFRKANLKTIIVPIDCGNWRCAKRIYKLPECELGAFADIIAKTLL